MTYLRVKKWKDWQHYKDREPPWVKLHRKLLQDDTFMALDEPVQWQLVRIWMLAAGASVYVLDEEGRKVPVVANHEPTLRRSIGTLKKIPLARFIQDGWLIEVEESDLLPPDAIPVLDECYPGASTDPPKTEPVEGGDASALLEAEQTEVYKDQDPAGQDRSEVREDAALPDDSLAERLAALGQRLEDGAAPMGTEGRLFEVLTDMDKDSPKVVRALLELLPVHVIEQVRSEVLAKQPRKPTAYAVGILQSRCAQRGVRATEEVA